MKTSVVMKLQKQCGVKDSWTISAYDKNERYRTTTHKPLLAYVRTGLGPISRTKELLKDRVFADFDKKGNLIGVEII